MESATKRAGEPSRGHHPTRPKQNRRSLKESSTTESPQRIHKKRKRRKGTSFSEYFPIRVVLDEKIENGETSYLIDWEDNPETGESYTPTWEPYENLTQRAIDDWIQIKEARTKEEASTAQEKSVNQSSLLDPDSQPPRTAKRRKTDHSLSSLLSRQPISKTPLRAGTRETARFQSVSQEVPDSQEKPKEIKDSYEEDQSLSDRSERIRVEVFVEEGFNPEEYSKVTAVSSQPSQPSQLSQASRPSDNSSRSEPKLPSTRSFIWDEDEHEADRVTVIQDSQYIPGSSSYVPSRTPASYSRATSQSNIGTDLGFTRRDSLASPCAAPVNFRHSEPPNHSSRTLFLDDSEPPWSSADDSGRISSGRQQRNTVGTKTQNNYILRAPGDLGPSNISPLSANSRSRIGGSHSAAPSALQTQTVAGGSSPHETSYSLSHVPAHQLPNFVDNGTGGHFLTQVPPATQEEIEHQSLDHQVSSYRPLSVENESSGHFFTQVPPATQEDQQSSNNHVIRGLHEGIDSQQLIQSEGTQFHSFGLDSLEDQSVAATQRSIPSSEVARQISKILPESSQDSRPQEEQSPVEQNQQSSIRDSQSTASLRLIPLSNDTIDIQRSSSKTQRHLSSVEESNTEVEQRYHHCEQPLENIPPSAQHIGDKVSSPLNDINHNSQNSPANSQDHLPLKQRLESEVEQIDNYSKNPSETILPSIEHIVDRTSTPPSRVPTKLNSTSTSHLYDLSSTPSPKVSTMADQDLDEISTAEKIRRSRIAAAEIKMEEQRAARTSSAIPYASQPHATVSGPTVGDIGTAEKLRRARMAAIELKISEQQAARTASAIPHTPPPAVNQMLPLRESAPEAPVMLTDTVPSLQASPEREREAATGSLPKAFPEQVDESPTGMNLLPLGKNVFAVPLPMAAVVRDLYGQEITNHRMQRRSFLNDEDIDQSLVDKINMMVERLKMICDHQDLIVEDSASQEMDSDTKARWAENISTKCIFLAELLESLRSVETHVALLVRPGKMMDIVEAVFQRHGYSYNRPDCASNQTGSGLLKISLLPTNVDLHNFGLEPASLVIAFDSTFVNGASVESLRADTLNANGLAPMIHLLITHSIEHVEMCVKKSMDPLERMAILVSSLSHTREDVGKLTAECLPPEAAAKAIADFVTGGATGEWPLVQMPVIEGFEVRETIMEEPNERPSESATQSYDATSSNALQTPFKRPLLDTESPESSKRRRLTPPSGSPSNINVSRIEETVLDALESRRKVTANVDDLNAAREDQIASFLEKILDLENQLRTQEAKVMELRQSNQRLEARCQDHDKSLETILPKYQEALNDRAQAAHDIQESMVRETSMRQKLDTRTAELAKVREEKALVDAELAAARAALSSSSIPEVAELQKSKDDLRAASLELERAKKKIVSAENDMEYMRNNYQKASSAAAEMRNELDKIKAENLILQRKASDNAVEIHRLQSDSQLKQYLQLISELEVEKTEVERELEKKSEELRTLLNGRRTTRGTSVPRSPRMGTMSPGQSTRPISRVLGGMGSRGNSPAPVGNESGFRGPGTFGDALFAPGGGPSRWGNHLS